MAVDLFSIVLTSAAAWGIGRVLDAAARCNCGTKRNRNLQNEAFNDQFCEHCGRSLRQYTNATIHTTNRNKSITSAHISNVRFRKKLKKCLEVHYDLDVVDSKYEDVVVKASLSVFNGIQLGEYETVFHPHFNRSKWKKTTFIFGQFRLPKEACTLAIDYKTYNLWGDPLHQGRNLATYGGQYIKRVR